MKKAAFLILAVTYLAPVAALPCSSMPPTFGDVNMGEEFILADTPLWVQVLNAGNTETFPIIVTNKTSNQPIAYELAFNHRDEGVFPPRYYKLVPETGIWGAVGDKLELSVDNSSAWFQQPLELPELEIVAEGLTFDNPVFLPEIPWPNVVTQEVIGINSCWPQGGWKITIPYMLYEENVPWGYVLVYTDNHEAPVRMIATNVLHEEASSGEVLRAWTHTDPGRCIRVVPVNLAEQTFEAAEYCQPLPDGSDAGPVTQRGDGGAERNLDAGAALSSADAGSAALIDSGTPATLPALDGGYGGLGPAPTGAGAAADGGTTQPPVTDEGCGCSQTKKRGEGFWSVGWLVLILRGCRRFRARAERQVAPAKVG